ncbi:MAG: hypothetical protein GY796_17625 [Chloroflexi bacterium]|nr:hypothetical protein [Chloroflexota bacterium]
MKVALAEKGHLCSGQHKTAQLYVPRLRPFPIPRPISSKNSTGGNYAHGSPYYKLLQTEVAALAQALHGAAGVKEQAAKHQLRKIDRAINSLKSKLAALKKEKVALQKRA